MNQAHEESLLLLNIVHGICKKENIKYTIAADTLIAYKHGLDFNECIPIIYVALFYKDFCILKEELVSYCEEHMGYSYHDRSNTEQFDAFEAWFVKESAISFPEKKRKDAFYYGTRLIMTPLFFAGDTEQEWKNAYKLFRDTSYAVTVRAVLKGKPLRSYIRLTRKRRLSNHYIKRRSVDTIEKCIRKYGDMPESAYLIYPQIMSRDARDVNSVPTMVTTESKNLTTKIIRDVEIINFYGQECYCIKKREIIENCFEEFAVQRIVENKKSQLALNGGTYLWRVQQIQIELLREFDRICRKYHIPYNISFGTLLGAIRHGGFIPWDDDIDITLLSEDFDRLDEIMKRELDSERYYFRCPATEEHNHLIFKHIERKGTLYTKSGRERLEQPIGVFIDIFPMYPSAHFFLSDWIHAKICRYWRTALWATVGAWADLDDEKKKKKFKKMAALGNKACYQNFVKAANFFQNKKYVKFWIAMDRNPYKVPLVRKSNYTDTIDVEFEGYRFMAPKEYEDVLNYCFGRDWKMYPSMRGRLPSHKAIMEIGDLYKAESEGKA